MTASKFGDLPGSASGIAVTAGGDTVQDFVLQAAPIVPVDGIVTDGSGQGWPLYAKIVVSGPRASAGATLFTDPVTGYYSIPLVAGGAYAFAVTAVGAGLRPGRRTADISAAGDAGRSGRELEARGRADLHRAGYATGSFAGPLASPKASMRGRFPPAGPSTRPRERGGTSPRRRPCGQFDGNRTGGSGPYAIVNSALRDGSRWSIPPSSRGRSTCRADERGDPVGQRLRRPRVGFLRQGRRQRRRRRELDEHLAGPDRHPGPRQPDRRHVVRGRASGRKARFHYQGFWAWWWQVDEVEIGPMTARRFRAASWSEPSGTPTRGRA